MSPEEIGVILKHRRQFLKLRQEDVAEILPYTLEKIASVLEMKLKIEVKQLEHG
jgi:hypothetical protein